MHAETLNFTVSKVTPNIQHVTGMRGLGTHYKAVLAMVTRERSRGRGRGTRRGARALTSKLHGASRSLGGPFSHIGSPSPSGALLLPAALQRWFIIV